MTYYRHAQSFRNAIGNINEPVVVVHHNDDFALSMQATLLRLGTGADKDTKPVAAYLPPRCPHGNSDRRFCKNHGLRLPA